MRVAIASARELPESLLARWSELNHCNPDLCSPFFSPAFTQAISRVRNDVFVAVIDDGDAFFPFQRSIFGFGRPVGGPVSDYHGLISEPDFGCDVVALMRACRLRSWDFNHLPASQSIWAPWSTRDGASPVLDLSEGGHPGSPKLHSNCCRSRRKLECEVGPIEVELETRDPGILDLCLEWKSAQYRRTGHFDLFARPWARRLAHVIASSREPAFAGTVSVLRAGRRPIAAHFGMRTGTVWHYWFPAYDPAFHQFAPGMLLLLSMIEGAPGSGVRTIDFGKGDEDYKLRLANRYVPLVKGSVVTVSSVRVLRETKASLLQGVRKLPLPQALSTQAEKLIQHVREKIQLSCYGMMFLLV
jgi:CelD/BcsL family acetyltransferase involved in cellulose biosynthesis